MTLKDDLLTEIEDTRERFLQFLESIPEKDYSLQSGNEAWTVGDVLYHVTLGPRAIVFEAWMIVHARGLFQFWMRHFPSRWFNRVNARFGRRDARRLSRAGLGNAYENAHTVLRSALMRTREQDFARSVVYPADLVAELAGEVSVERLFRYTKWHFEAHAEQIASPHPSTALRSAHVCLRHSAGRTAARNDGKKLWYNPASDWSCPTVFPPKNAGLGYGHGDLHNTKERISTRHAAR